MVSGTQGHQSFMARQDGGGNPTVADGIAGELVLAAERLEQRPLLSQVDPLHAVLGQQGSQELLCYCQRGGFNKDSRMGHQPKKTRSDHWQQPQSLTVEARHQGRFQPVDRHAMVRVIAAGCGDQHIHIGGHDRLRPSAASKSWRLLRESPTATVRPPWP